MIRQLAPGMVQQMQSVCSDCNGEGMHAVTSAFMWKWIGNEGVGEAYSFSLIHVCIHLIKEKIQSFIFFKIQSFKRKM